MEKRSNKLQKLGSVSAFYGAGAFLIAIIFFLFIIDYPSLTEQIDKIKVINDNQLLFVSMYLISYVLFGFFLVILTLAIHERLRFYQSPFANITTVYGLIWATLLIGSGMVFITGIKVTMDLYPDDPSYAIMVFTSMEAVSMGLGFAYGEIMGGIWILLVSIIAIKSNVFHKGLNILGSFIGAIGIVSIIPVLNDLGGLFGILLIIWFIWLGIALLKGNTEDE